MPIELKPVIRKALADKLAAAAKTPATMLKEADDAAKTKRQATDPKATPYRFAINYRLDKTAPSSKGHYTKRYSALMVLLRTLGGKQWQQAELAALGVKGSLPEPVAVNQDELLSRLESEARLWRLSKNPR